MALAVISLGSNKGHRERNLALALRFLLSDTRICLDRISSIYKTEPVDDEDQPFFYNAAASLETDLSPEKLFRAMTDAERRVGKEKERSKGPRRIDLDLLFYDSEIIHSDALVVPHPSITQRLFVLKPLMEIIPFFLHPAAGRSIRDLYFGVETDKRVALLRAFPLLSGRKRVSEVKSKKTNT